MMNKSISVNISYNISKCNHEYPLLVTIKNNSPKTLTKVEWHLNIYMPGYSTDIAGWQNEYSSDKILKPGEMRSSCYKLPLNFSAKNQDPSSLKYEVSNKYFYFQN
jgi:hypothetical protein